MYKENNNRLKQLVQYIEDNLTEKIEYKKLAQILLVNEYTLHRVFYFVTNISLADYIRKRRLSRAAIELLEEKNRVIDIAIKYQYDSAIAFSRAFKKMMGFNPKEIREKQQSINYFPVLKFDDREEMEEVVFQKVENVSFEVFVIGRKTTIKNLSNVAQAFWKKINKEKSIEFEEKSYGIVAYNKHLKNSNEEVIYYIGSTKEFEGSKRYNVENKKFLVFMLDTIDGEKISKFTKDIYANVIPNLGYNLDDIPDIEEYINDKITKIYIPII